MILTITKLVSHKINILWITLEIFLIFFGKQVLLILRWTNYSVFVWLPMPRSIRRVSLRFIISLLVFFFMNLLYVHAIFQLLPWIAIVHHKNESLFAIVLIYDFMTNPWTIFGWGAIFWINCWGIFIFFTFGSLISFIILH